ncbi:MAG: radical SAM protein [Nitrospirae bacterium]|nr:radical SAM protein [Nitrospirota bacterium]MBF0591989.1 radical SAM protein [Nitrospirota bacterium]
MSTILRDRGYEVKAFIEDVARPDWSYVESSDIVCISTITSTAVGAYRIAERIKALGIPVIMGGAHPSFMPEEALTYADYVVRGEGDNTIVELLDSLQKGTPTLRSIPGISYKEKDGTVVNTPTRPLLLDLDSLPVPDFSLVHKWRSNLAHPISTSRGCPFNCRFCSVISMFGRKYRFKSVEASLNEIRYAAPMTRHSKFFVDDNFAANKERTKELCRGIIADNIKMKWSAQVRTDVAKDLELLRLFADSGCEVVQIGFESINPATLKNYNKGQSLDEIINCIKLVREHGIKIHGMFVFGADTDDVDTIRKTADFAMELGIETIQFMVLTPLPGTPFFTEMKEAGRLFHTDWSKYDAQHVLFEPALMKPQTLQIESLKSMGRFYSWKYIFRHLAKLDFFHAAMGYYGKQAINQALKEAKDYLSSLTNREHSFTVPAR